MWPHLNKITKNTHEKVHSSDNCLVSLQSICRLKEEKNWSVVVSQITKIYSLKRMQLQNGAEHFGKVICPTVASLHAAAVNEAVNERAPYNLGNVSEL
jgi:hypothetical protein